MPDGGLMCPACHARTFPEKETYGSLKAARASVRAAEQTEGCDIVIVKVHGGYAIRLPRQKETNPT